MHEYLGLCWEWEYSHRLHSQIRYHVVHFILQYVTRKIYIFPRNVCIGNLRIAAGRSAFIHTQNQQLSVINVYRLGRPWNTEWRH